MRKYCEARWVYLGELIHATLLAFVIDKVEVV